MDPDEVNSCFDLKEFGEHTSRMKHNQIATTTLRFLVGACLSLPILAQAEIVPVAGGDISDIAPAGAKVEKLGGDMKFTEGPVWRPDKKQLIFSDIPAAKLMQWTAAEGVRPYRDCENANGNTLDTNGLLVSCQHGGRNLVREEKDGKLTVLIEKHDGKKYNSPNDAVVKSDGSIYFTDPPYGTPKGQEKEAGGNFVYRLAADGKTTSIVNREFDMPNGLCFSPDEKRLYIADSGSKKRVGAFPVNADGTLGEALFWMEGGADGIRCDEKGRIYTTAGDGVRIYADTGKQIGLIKLPEHPANCAFGGEDNKTLFITARTGLYAIKLSVAGATPILSGTK